MRVMIVDDEQPCLDDMIFLLSQQNGVEIAGAFTKPAEALAAASELCPDALFLDICMPRLSGPELARQILARRPSVKLIFVTAYAKEKEGIRDLPVFGSLLKPVSVTQFGQLLERLRSALPGQA